MHHVARAVPSFLFLDIELGRDAVFHALAARRDGEERLWERDRGASLSRAHRDLVAWLHPDDILTGHNLHRFDRAAFTERFPDSPLLRLPTLDTLELSVLAFPRRPYHRLVKDDRLVRDARPSPLSDVRASERVLEDALAAWDPSPLITQADLPDHVREGWRRLYEEKGWPWRGDGGEDGNGDGSGRVDLRLRWHGRVCLHSPRLSSPESTWPSSCSTRGSWFRTRLVRCSRAGCARAGPRSGRSCATCGRPPPDGPAAGRLT